MTWGRPALQSAAWLESSRPYLPQSYDVVEPLVANPLGNDARLWAPSGLFPMDPAAITRRWSNCTDGDLRTQAAFTFEHHQNRRIEHCLNEAASVSQAAPNSRYHSQYSGIRSRVNRVNVSARRCAITVRFTQRTACTEPPVYPNINSRLFIRTFKKKKKKTSRRSPINGICLRCLGIIRGTRIIRFVIYGNVGLGKRILFIYRITQLQKFPEASVLYHRATLHQRIRRCRGDR